MQLAAFISVTLTVVASGCSATEPASLSVKGVIEQAMGPERYGATALTILQMTREPRKLDEFLRKHVGEACGTGPRGAEVLVRDADGTVVGLGHVANTAVIVPQESGNGLLWSVACQWEFTVSGVPELDGIYGLSVDGGEEAHFSADELREPLRLRIS